MLSVSRLLVGTGLSLICAVAALAAEGRSAAANRVLEKAGVTRGIAVVLGRRGRRWHSN